MVGIETVVWVLDYGNIRYTYLEWNEQCGYMRKAVSGRESQHHAVGALVEQDLAQKVCHKMADFERVLKRDNQVDKFAKISNATLGDCR